MTDMPTSYPRSGNVCGDILSPQMRLFKVTEANARQRAKSSGNPFPDEEKGFRPKSGAMDSRTGREGVRLEISTIEARQGTRENVVRYVLAVSMAVVIGGFAVIYYIYA
jgi:hypothetical protein